MSDHHVIVSFGKDIPYDLQCSEMLEFERRLRSVTGLRIEVFAKSRGDDSKLRMLMTPEQRAKL